jgi:hypothetical protein
MHITKGAFGNTKLDGVTFAMALWWPRAIHLGNGIGRYYIDPSSSPAQREALAAITSGQNGGGFFEIFPKTFRKMHPMKVNPIEFHYDGYDSWFKVDGIGEVHSEHIRNAVTNDPFEGTIDLPGGIIFKSALVTSIKRWWMHDEDLLAANENKNGHVALVKFSEKGCIG